MWAIQNFLCQAKPQTHTAALPLYGRARMYSMRGLMEANALHAYPQANTLRPSHSLLRPWSTIYLASAAKPRARGIILRAATLQLTRTGRRWKRVQFLPRCPLPSINTQELNTPASPSSRHNSSPNPRSQVCAAVQEHGDCHFRVGKAEDDDLHGSS
jgi:hypothetical protein